MLDNIKQKRYFSFQIKKMLKINISVITLLIATTAAYGDATDRYAEAPCVITKGYSIKDKKSYYHWTSPIPEGTGYNKDCKGTTGLEELNNLVDGGASSTEINNIITNLEANQNAKNAKQDERLDGHDVDLTDIKNKNKQQDTRLDANDQTNAKQNERLDGHDVDIADIKDVNNKQNKRLDGHDVDIADIKDVNNKQNKRLDGHDVDIADIKDVNNKQNKRLDGHDVDIADIKDVNNKQNKRLDGHDTDISFLREQDRLAVKYIPDANGAPTNVVKLTGDRSGAPVTITNVNAGVNDLDAVNKKQLDGVLAGIGGGAHVDNKGNVVGPTYNINNHTYNDIGSALSATNVKLDQLVNNNNARFDALNKRVTDVRKEARAGIAGASALAGMRYDDRAGKLSLASGLGGFQDSQAMSLGVGYTTEDGVFRLNAGASYDFQGQGTAWNMGLGWTLN